MIARLGTTPEDVEAWKCCGLPTRKIVWAVQRFRNPATLAEHEAKVDAEDSDPSLRRSEETRREAVLKARARESDPKLRELEDDEARSRAMAAQAKETLRETREAAGAAVPPPADFMGAYRALKAQHAKGGEPPR